MTAKYGEENVCHIVTFGTLAAKQAIQDVSRTLGNPASFGAKISNLIPSGPGVTIDSALKTSPDFLTAYQTSPEVKQVVDIARRLEGNKRHASQHACFEAGTTVSTDKGPVAIETIKPGMYVLTDKGRYQPVIDTMTSTTAEVYIIKPFNGQEVRVTGNHPLLTKRQGTSSLQWIAVKALNPDTDMLVIESAGSFEPVGFAIKVRQVAPQTMYNLTVMEDSSYVANGIVAHNCGLVCSPSAVSDYLPTSMELDKETGLRGLTSQVTKDEVEEMSLIKMDLLGLKTLGVIHEIIDRVQVTRGLSNVLAQIHSTRPTLRYQDIPLDDRKVYQMLAKGQTGAVFQLESEGMSSLIDQMFSDIDILPEERLGECFERLIAAVALYRPGPMDYIPNYIAGLQDCKNIKYLTPELKEILEPTYGVIVYQEQVMQIVQKLAGYTLGRADVVRKGCAKKHQEILDAEQKVFIHGNKEAFESGKDKNYAPGCVANGISEGIATELWHQMENFGKYA